MTFKFPGARSEETDNYTCTVNEAVQTWNEDPPNNNQGMQGHLWDLVKQDDGTYLISSTQENPSLKEKLFLQASANTPKEFNAAYPRLQRRDNSNRDLQSWVLLPIYSEISDYANHPRIFPGYFDTFAIQPKLFPDYALGIQNNGATNHTYVIANRTYGAPTFSHYWRISKIGVSQ